jgi:4-carboxymuconolactone decarboxylase
MEIVASHRYDIHSTQRSAMERIRPLEPPYSPEVAEHLAAMMPPGVEPLGLFRTLARNPRVLARIRAGSLLDRGSLDRADRELAILRTCARCGSEYEWGVHVVVFARRYGIAEDKISGTVLWETLHPGWALKERAIVRLADELHDTSTVGDDLWTELERHFEPAQVVELLVLIGFYHAISFVTNGLSIALEKAGARFPAAASGPGPT